MHTIGFISPNKSQTAVVFWEQWTEESGCRSISLQIGKLFLERPRIFQKKQGQIPETGLRNRWSGDPNFVRVLYIHLVVYPPKN